LVDIVSFLFIFVESLKLDFCFFFSQNLQDLPNAYSAAQISDALGLAQLKDRRWQICKSVATAGEGLQDGLDWIVQALQNK
jgi:signal recognition particle receptor subunit beta